MMSQKSDLKTELEKYDIEIQSVHSFIGNYGNTG